MIVGICMGGMVVWLRMANMASGAWDANLGQLGTDLGQA